MTLVCRRHFYNLAYVEKAGISARPRGPLRTILTGVAASLLALLMASPVAAQQVAWEQWQHQVGIVDLGLRSDGSLVAMVAGHLQLVSAATGAATAFGDFSADPAAESYFVVTPDLAETTPACAWQADDLYVLDLTSPPGIARVDAQGHASHFATLSGVDTLGGIALDTVGRFDHHLLVTGTHDSNQTTVFSLDCQGGVSVLTSMGPVAEGGLAVAPSTFGAFGGDLIAPDENSGQIWAFDPGGNATLVANSGLPSGGDTGVESAGFVPPGFTARASAAYAYLSDRGTPDNPFPGTDSLLRLSSSALASAGVQDGDLLLATEGGGTTIAVRCAETCTVEQAAQGTNGGHIEGHLVFL